jgi:hypothetical protein
MKTRIFLFSAMFLAALVLVSFKLVSSPADSPASKVPSIEGTYVFQYRTLPDGTVLKPPAVSGIQTFTKDKRNFNIMWTDKSGKRFSFSVYSDYKFTDKDYTETIHFGVLNDEIDGKGLTYITDQTKTVPIKYENGKLQFHLPFDPPDVTFQGNEMIATLKGATDHWVRIKE